MNHWKDRDPKETVRIIDDFFKSKNFNIKKVDNTEVNNNYWTHIELWSPDNKLLLAKANGKGVTEELCEASAYGELYERYCGFRPDKLNVQNSPLNYNYMDYAYTLVKTINNGNLFTSKYTNIKNKNDEIYLSRDVLEYLFGTTGLSCGNSASEAILQAICELCERYVITKLLNTEGSFGYLIGTKDNEKLGLHFEILDLSFDFKLPVIAIKVIDNKNYCVGYSFGCHPIKEIAIERCITEFTQGAITYWDKILISSSRLYPINYYREDYTAKDNLIQIFSSGNGFIPFTKFRTENIDQNKESGYFITDFEKINTNDDLLVFLLNEINANIYVSNISQCDQMFAVHVYSPELELDEQNDFRPTVEDFNYFKTELEYNAILRDAVKNRNIEKAMHMLKSAILIYDIPIYPAFYRECAFSNQIDIYFAALLGLYLKDFELYNDAMNKIVITTDAIYELSMIDATKEIDFNYWFSYII